MDTRPDTTTPVATVGEYRIYRTDRIDRQHHGWGSWARWCAVANGERYPFETLREAKAWTTTATRRAA